MQLSTAPLVIERYATYQKSPREGGGDMTYGDGTPVEYVEVRDPESQMDEGLRRFTLDRAINGSRAEVGAKVGLVLRDWIEPDAKTGTYGAYIGRKRKNLVVGFVKS
jgi:hypothetical protein